MLKIAPLWIGARGLEFDWKYTQESIEANISLLRYIGFVTAVWLYRRKISIKYSLTFAIQQNLFRYSLDPDVRGTAQMYQKVAAITLMAYVVLPSVLSYLNLVLRIIFILLY